MLLSVNASSVASCRERLVNREIRLEPTQSNPPVKLRPPVNQTPLRLPVVAKGESVVDTWQHELSGFQAPGATTGSGEEER